MHNHFVCDLMKDLMMDLMKDWVNGLMERYARLRDVIFAVILISLALSLFASNLNLM